MHWNHRTTRCRVLGALIFVFTGVVGTNVYAQPTMKPSSLSVDVSMVNFLSRYDDYQGTHSRETTGVRIESFALWFDSTVRVIFDGDAVTITSSYPVITQGYSTTGSALVSFVLDSNARLLRDCRMSFSSSGSWSWTDPPYTHYFSASDKSSFHFYELPYDIVNDSMIVVDVDSNQCALLLLGASYAHSTSERYQTRYPHNSGYSNSSDSVDAITALDRCYLSFKRSPSTFLDVRRGNEHVTASTITAAHLPGGDVTLWLPLQLSGSMLTVVNILGRTVVRQPIATDHRRVDLPHLPPGLYFARLGEMATSFVIP